MWTGDYVASIAAHQAELSTWDRRESLIECTVWWMGAGRGLNRVRVVQMDSGGIGRGGSIVERWQRWWIHEWWDVFYVARERD